MTSPDTAERRPVEAAAFQTPTKESEHSVGADVIVPVIRARTDRRGVRSVTVVCPFCGCTHVHGWPPDHAQPGHRLSHCSDGGLGYTIEVAS